MFYIFTNFSINETIYEDSDRKNLYLMFTKKDKK